MRKAISRYEANHIYFERVQSAMKDILTHSGHIEHPFFEVQEQGAPAFIVITSDKGLCGGYNHDVLTYAYEEISKHDKKFVITVGQQARVFFNKKNIEIDVEFLHIAADPTLNSARELAEELSALYIHHDISEINIIFTRYYSTFSQKVEVLKLLPLENENFTGVALESSYNAQINYIPKAEEVFTILVPQYLNGLIFGALVHAYASENCARMTAMDNATKNADEMLSKLSTDLARARQYAITSEISEIVAATEAIKY